MSSCNNKDCPMNQGKDNEKEKSVSFWRHLSTRLQGNVKTQIQETPLYLEKWRGFDAAMINAGLCIAVPSLGAMLIRPSNVFLITFFAGFLFCLIGYFGGKFWPGKPPRNKKVRSRMQQSMLKHDDNRNDIDNSENHNGMKQHLNIKEANKIIIELRCPPEKQLKDKTEKLYESLYDLKLTMLKAIKADMSVDFGEHLKFVFADLQDFAGCFVTHTPLTDTRQMYSLAGCGTNTCAYRLMLKPNPGILQHQLTEEINPHIMAQVASSSTHLSRYLTCGETFNPECYETNNIFKDCFSLN